MTYFVLKCGRIFNALLGVMASFFVSILFSDLNVLLYCSLFLCLASIVLLFYLLGFCEVFDHKAYALKSDDNPNIDIDKLAFRNTLMARKKMKSLNEQDKVMNRFRWKICGAFLVVVLFLISAAVCARNGWNKKEEKRNKDLIESVQTIVEEKNIGSFKDVKDHIDAARDSLNQSIKLIPFQGSQQK